MGLDNEPRVLVWGLNDKDQLGGLKGSKIKMSSHSETLASLRPIHISGGSKSLFVVSQDGKVCFNYFLPVNVQEALIVFHLTKLFNFIKVNFEIQVYFLFLQIF